MKVIVQMMPNEVETNLYDLNIDDFIVDIDTYGYFLDEVFWKGVQDFIEKKYKIKFKHTLEEAKDSFGKQLQIKLKDMENPKDDMDDSMKNAMKVQNMFDNQDLIVKYWQKYNKIRDKFYLYKGDIYSYEFIGFMNVGHVIQIFKYDMLDLCNICNKLQKKERWLFKR